ncbi:MAG: pyridoxal phosphate-dependent decarboxylase family protein, partial [Alphaproteobacteria bacterium]
MPRQNPFSDFDGVLRRALAISTDYIAGLPDRPVGTAVSPEAMAIALDEPLSEDGCEPEAAIADWFARAEVGIVASPGPRFFGFVNGGSTPAALAGDWLASALDQNAGLWISSPAASHTEQTVLRWLKDLFSLPTAWSGGLTSGATMANLVGLAAGRQWVGQHLGFDPADDGLGGHPPIHVLSSTEIHASARKALAVLGLGRNSVHTVAAPGGVVDLPALAEALAAIDAPVMVVANAGEVNTGAFDPLDEIAALCKAHRPGAWLHVDGAFGLFAAASPRSKHLVKGIEAADSVASDAHKWLNVPYDSGFVFVRDGEALRQAMSATAAYIAPQDGRWDP